MIKTGPVYHLNPREKIKYGFVSIPLPGTHVRIIDAETGLKEFPAAESGEVCSSGPQIMKGYLDSPKESVRALHEMNSKTWIYFDNIQIRHPQDI